MADEVETGFEESPVPRNDNLAFNEKAAVLASPVSEEGVNLTSNDGHLTIWLVLTAITCFLGSSFQFGYNLGVVNAPKDVSCLHYFHDFTSFCFSYLIYFS